MVKENLSRRAVPSSPDVAACVMAAHGIVAKYRSVASASWQHDTSTTSKGGMFLFIGLQQACLLAWSLVSKGVGCWQGGHQSALK